MNDKEPTLKGLVKDLWDFCYTEDVRVVDDLGGTCGIENDYDKTKEFNKKLELLRLKMNPGGGS